MDPSEKDRSKTVLQDLVLFTPENLTNSSNLITSFASPFNGNVVEVTAEVDEAMKLAMLCDDPVRIDHKRGRRLLWKIDLFLIPVMSLLYAFQFMDKLSNSYALILGLRTALNMTVNKYAWTGSVFYFGYLVFAYPAVLILQRLPVSKTLGSFVLIWGLVMCLHTVCDYSGFVVLRAVLGALESSVTPAFVIITSQYYCQSETFSRTTFWFSNNGVGQMIGAGAIAYNVYENRHDLPVMPWKILFIVSGVLTIFAGLLILYYIPDSPAKAWFLNYDDKRLLIERIRPNQQGFGTRIFKKKQFKEAFTDPKCFLLVMFACVSNIPNGAITNFSGILVREGLGYSVAETMLVQIPFGAVEFVGSICVGLLSQYWLPSRMLWSVFGTIVGIVGCTILAFSKNPWVALVGYWLMGMAPLGFMGVLSCVSSNVLGHTKKTTVIAMVLMSYCVGNLIGPQTFQPRDAPHYTIAKVLMLSFNCIALCTLLVLWYMYWEENKRRDACEKSAPEFDRIVNREFADLTDLENPLFRYSY